MAKTKSKKQVGYLLSNSSPLTSGQQAKLKSELHSGAVKVKTRSPKKPSKYSSAKFEKTRKKVYKLT